MTNQKTTRAGYGHPGLQSIDIHTLSSKAKSCSMPSLLQLLSVTMIDRKDKSIQEHEKFFMKGLRARIEKDH